LSGPNTQRLLQITDLHLRAVTGDTLLGVDTWHSVEAVLDQALAEHQPDALLITGDVAQDPDPDLYARFYGWLKGRYPGPTLVTPGNHDIAGNMGALLETERLELAGWQVLPLDSHVDDEPQALVSEADFAALAAACNKSANDSANDHLLVATHHPPVDIGCPWLDRDRIQNGRELLEWMAEHGRIRALVFGHAHQELNLKHRHLSLLGTPSTCIQFEPGSSRFSVDEQKPGYRWLLLGEDGSVRSEVRRVADYPLKIDRSAFKPKS
jgi:Icc protein